MRKKYTVCLADPPWFYDDRAKAGNRGAESQYPVMRDDAIANLDVASIMADDSALFLWVTEPKLEIGIWVLRRWGFSYKNFAFTWIKLTNEGKPKINLGHWTRSNAEHVLLGIRGRPERVNAGVNSVVMTVPGKHSAKPIEVHERIESLFGDVPRIELFARNKVPGWDSLGHDVGTGDIQKTLGSNRKGEIL